MFHLRVLGMFVRNALVRELSFRSNFLITFFSRLCWFCAQLYLFGLVFQATPTINDWTRPQYFAFMATGMLINSLVEAFFMPNCAQFSELIRTGNLDFALLKPIDPQFLVSFEKLDLSMLNQILFAGSLLAYALSFADRPPTLVEAGVYLLLVLAAVTFFYSLMISLACTSIWFGRNQGLLDFWFYVTIFARYPGSIYSGSPLGEVIRFAFSYVVPILIVVTTPARHLMAMTLDPTWAPALSVAAAVGSLFVSRRVFMTALNSYRSASS